MFVLIPLLNSVFICGFFCVKIQRMNLSALISEPSCFLNTFHVHVTKVKLISIFIIYNGHVENYQHQNATKLALHGHYSLIKDQDLAVSCFGVFHKILCVVSY